MKVRKIFLGLIILFFAAGVSYYIWHDLTKKPTSDIGFEVATSTPDTQTPNSLLGYPIAKEIPNLDKPINITADLPEDAKKIAQEKIEKLSSELKQDPSLFENWLVLGIYRKMIGDYEGAKECWEYASFLMPQSSVPFNNLGDLYAYYLKDSNRSEENFLKAIKNNPSQIFIYRSLYELYHYVMKDDIKAKQILEQGIKVNPNTSQELKILLDNL